MSINKTYAVFGLGRYGLAVAKELVANGAEVIAVDRDPRKVENAVGLFPICKCADVADPDVIKQLEISSVDTVIIAMAEKLEASVLAITHCKDAGVKEIIVKCANEMHMKIYTKVGASKVVFPEMESGSRLAKNLLSSGFIDVAEISDDISIVEIEVPNKWNGKTLRDIDIRKKHSLNVIALIKGGLTQLISDPDVVLDCDTKLVVIANKKDIEKFVY